MKIKFRSKICYTESGLHKFSATDKVSKYNYITVHPKASWAG